MLMFLFMLFMLFFSAIGSSGEDCLVGVQYTNWNVYEFIIESEQFTECVTAQQCTMQEHTE